MPFIQAAMDEAAEAEVVPEGQYHVRNYSAEVKQSKRGSDMIVVTSIVESAEHPNAAPIMTYLSLPTDEDEPKAKAFKLLQLARFCACFEIAFDSTGFDTDDIAGSEGDCLVKQESYQPVTDDGSPDPNKEPLVSNKLVLPRLSNEPKEEKKSAPKQQQRASAGRRR